MDMPQEDSYKYTSMQQCRLKADNEQQEVILRKGQAKITCVEGSRVTVGESSSSLVALQQVILLWKNKQDSMLEYTLTGQRINISLP